MPLGHIDPLLRDTRHAIRRLARDWRFAAAAVLILGLGIGANTAIFSLVNATLLRRDSVADPERLVDIYRNASNAGGVDGNSYQAYLDMAAYTDARSRCRRSASGEPRGPARQRDGLGFTTAIGPMILFASAFALGRNICERSFETSVT
jgi:hypothetical protein